MPVLVGADAIHLNDVQTPHDGPFELPLTGFREHHVAVAVPRRQHAAQPGRARERRDDRLSVVQLEVLDRRANVGLHLHRQAERRHEVARDPVELGIEPLAALVHRRAAHEVAGPVLAHDPHAAVGAPVERLGRQHIAGDDLGFADPDFDVVLALDRGRLARRERHRDVERAADRLQIAIHIALQPALEELAVDLHPDARLVSGVGARVLLSHQSCLITRSALPGGTSSGCSMCGFRVRISSA
ncbi:hypothetical protein FQZ97_984160 [compost metagenome]